MAGAREETAQTACKPGSVRTSFWARDDHSSGTRLAARLTRPTRTARRECPAPGAPCGAPPSLFGLAPGGVYPAAPVARGAVRSCRTVSPLPAGPPGLPGDPCAGGLFSVALSLGSPPPAVGRHRIPVEPGLSSIRLQRQRPSGRLAGERCAGGRGASSVGWSGRPGGVAFGSGGVGGRAGLLWPGTRGPAWRRRKVGWFSQC